MRVVFLNVFGGILSFFAKLLRLDGLSAQQLHPTSAKKLRRGQMRGAIDQMRVCLAGNAIFAPLMAFQAWNSGINATIVLWMSAILIFSGWLFLRWNTSYLTRGSELDMRWFVRETCLNAGLWCLGMMLFYPHVSGNEKTILTTVMTGSLAVGTIGFSQAPRAAFWYLGIHAVTLTLVPLVFGLYSNSAPDLIIAVLAVTASSAIFGMVLDLVRSQMAAFLDQEALLQKSEVVDLLLKDYEDQSVSWVWRSDGEGAVLACPSQVLELISDESSCAAGQPLLDALIKHVEPQGSEDLEKVKTAFANKTDIHDVTLPLYSEKTQSIRWIVMRGRPQFEGTEFIGFRGIFADATATVEAQKQIEFLAKNDPLTGAYNRNSIQVQLENLDPLEDKSIALLIDLDGFKLVNDSYGHTIGDTLLQRVTDRLMQIVGQAGIVARLGGDEFLILTGAETKYSYQDEDELAGKILQKLSEPFLIGQYDISISASIGTARFPYDTSIGPSLLSLADLALYAAKKGGRNKFVVFKSHMQEGLQKRMEVTNRLRSALNEGSILPHYQPQYCSKTNSLVGFEALARWKDAELGVVGPDIFIPIAEETGMVHELGESLINAACRDAMLWTSEASVALPTVAVNISPVQVMRGDVVGMIRGALEKSGLPSHRLEIEVTEGVLIEDMAGTSKVLTEIAKLGVKIALDDFGTGYSSLSYLRALPLHRLKIDRSFVTDIEDPEAQSVVQTIIDLCRRLELDVVAEGVETKQNFETLRKLNCGVQQGYYFSRPVPFSATQAMLDHAAKNAA